MMICMSNPLEVIRLLFADPVTNNDYRVYHPLDRSVMTSESRRCERWTSFEDILLVHVTIQFGYNSKQFTVHIHRKCEQTMLYQSDRFFTKEEPYSQVRWSHSHICYPYFCNSHLPSKKNEPTATLMTTFLCYIIVHIYYYLWV